MTVPKCTSIGFRKISKMVACKGLIAGGYLSEAPLLPNKGLMRTSCQLQKVVPLIWFLSIANLGGTTM